MFNIHRDKMSVDKRIEIMEYLLDLKSDINKQDELGQTALHIAVKNNDVDVINMLIKRGADANIKNCNGLTPLQYMRNKN